MSHMIDVPNLQGWPVLRVWRGSVYVRIPAEYRRPIAGGCSCRYCKAHPAVVPAWDTLGIPLKGQRNGNDTWIVHAPEWTSADVIPDSERE